jgi:hypothetical protein
MGYISYSLWGDGPIYNVGIIRNSELYKRIYPDWKMVVYYKNLVSKKNYQYIKLLLS